MAPKFMRSPAVSGMCFDTDPPFAITYDTSNGSVLAVSWEPRVADPRGRSFTLAVEAKF
jgi:iron complex outermembrane receptor protein